MSGGITQLVALGAQDAYLVGDPEVSFFRSVYKRHTNFAQQVSRQVIQGNKVAGGLSVVKLERRGDLLSYVYLVQKNASGVVQTFGTAEIDKVELYIGGQLIDMQDNTFNESIWNEVFCSQDNLVKENNPTNAYPLHFFFCDNYAASLPLIALQFHDVEIRITWASALPDSTDQFECYANYISLDDQEREWFANHPQEMLITQVQRQLSSNKTTQDFDFNHPVKAIVTQNDHPGSGNALSTSLKVQYNGSEIGEPKEITPHFNQIPSYYHTFNSNEAAPNFLMSYGLNVSKYHPTGTMNFSRLDSARITLGNSETFTKDEYFYAINYNILKIENGMGGILYAN